MPALPARRQPEGPIPPEVVPARSGKPALRIGGISVHSSYDPVREAATWARGILKSRTDTEGTLVVVFGCGLGYHLRALSDSGVGSIISFEPDQRVDPLRDRAGLVGPSQDVVVTGCASDLAREFRVRYPKAESTLLVSIPAYARLFPEEYAEFNTNVGSMVQELKADCLTYVVSAADWVMLTIRNMPVMARHPTVRALYGQARGRPALVVSPGPSLEKNIDVLARYRDRFLVISPSQSLRALTSAGIQPDLVVVADSQQLSYHFEDCPKESYQNLVIGAKCHPEVLKLPARRRFFYHTPFNTLARSFFGLVSQDPCDLNAGHSVANVAFSLAVVMDANPVVLVGQDLAFSGDKMYCANSVDGGQPLEFQQDGDTLSMNRFLSKLRLGDERNQAGLIKRLAARQQVVWVDGHDGQQVPTTNDLRAMLTWFERTAAELAGDRRLINSTEGGAFIKGMQHQPLEQVAGQFGSRDPVGLEERLDGLAEVSQRQVKSALSGMRRMAGEFRSLGQTAGRCDALARRALRQGASDLDSLVALQKMEKKLTNRMSRYMAVDALVQKSMRCYRSLGDPEQDDLALNLERSRLLYQATQEACRTLQEALKEAVRKGENYERASDQR